MKTFLINDVEIKIYKSHLSKKLTISIKPTGTIRISIPRYVSYLEAERFAQQKKDWIFANLKKFEENSTKQDFVPISGLVTKKHKLILGIQGKTGITLRVYNGIISIKHNESLNVNSKEVKNAIKKGILKALKKESLEYLPNRLSQLASKHSLTYTAISIKNMKTRWGSCTGKNKIILNTHLMSLPDYLIDYVLLHELAHTKIKNHSRLFWDYLENICAKAKNLDIELKSYKILNV